MRSSSQKINFIVLLGANTERRDVQAGYIALRERVTSSVRTSVNTALRQSVLSEASSYTTTVTATTLCTALTCAAFFVSVSFLGQKKTITSDATCGCFGRKYSSRLASFFVSRVGREQAARDSDRAKYSHRHCTLGGGLRIPCIQ